MSPYQLTLLFATELTERTEFSGLSLRALPLAMTEKACRQNLFFSVCSVTSVAKRFFFMPHSLVMAIGLNPGEYK